MCRCWQQCVGDDIESATATLIQPIDCEFYADNPTVPPIYFNDQPVNTNNISICNLNSILCRLNGFEVNVCRRNQNITINR